MKECKKGSEKMNELKPCPFCGSDNISGIEFYGERYFLHCRNCGIEQRLQKSKEEAIEAWNKRSDDK